MPIQKVAVERFIVVSSRSFAEVVGAIDTAIGHPDIHTFWKDIAAAHSWNQLEETIHAVLGNSGFMEFTRFDHGQFLKKGGVVPAPQIVRIVLGNPLIMKRMAEHVPDAGSYAPVTILVDERPDGVHISYDRMASFLAPYGNWSALAVAQELDAKVEALITAAAG
jgi:uncharacterized protein (DUF302 family)